MTIYQQIVHIKWSFYKTYYLTLEAKSVKAIWFDNITLIKVQNCGQNI